MKGSYILLIRLPEALTITTGSRRAWQFPGGYYAYVGSAMGGLESRISRHLTNSKKHHWHIDYLLDKASISGVILCETEARTECTIARALNHQLDSITGFGSSDCRCQSHLFFATNERQMKSTTITALNSLDMSPRLLRL